MLDLALSFDALQPPASTESAAACFSAIPIPGYEQHRLGMDSSGAPSLLVSVVGSRKQAWPAPIVLEHLIVQHDVHCLITQLTGQVEEGKFTVVRCTGSDDTLRVYFLQVTAAVVALLGEAPTHAAVSEAIDKLVELFRSMTKAPRKSVQGLWAELLLMARLRNPAPLVAAWHALPSDRYDFSAGNQRIEVKSAAGRVRQHYFALEQLLPIPGTLVLVASILVERAGAGVSLLELVSEVRSRVGHDPQLLLHVDLIVAQTVGDGWRSAQNERFDRQFGESSLTFFEPANIPRVSSSMPPGVSHVRFLADLTGAAAVDSRQYRLEGGLFQACLTR